MNVVDKLAPSPRDHLLGADGRGMRVSRNCRAAPRIPLSRKGLPGPPDIFATSYDCESRPKTVVMRIKAVVQASSSWRPDPPAHLELMKPISCGELVLQAPSGKRFAYATIAGKDFRLWVSPDCVRE